MILLLITLMLIAVSVEINKTDVTTTIEKETFDGTDLSDIEEQDSTSEQDYHEMEDSHIDNAENDDQVEIISTEFDHFSDDSKSHPPAFGPPKSDRLSAPIRINGN